MQSARNGLLVLDKPAGMTSRDAVDLASRWWPRQTRIGHTGTLDPLATGVLVLCFGAATRLAEYVQALEKVYRAGIVLGTESTTDDAEGQLSPWNVTAPPSAERLEAVLQGFVGTTQQIPPAHSAAKVAGRRAYALARQGRAVTLSARPVSIYALTILEYTYPRLSLEVCCGKGTYIRALARDLGARLECGAYLESLRRTRVGHFTVEDAISLNWDREMALSRLRPPVEAVRNLRHLVVDENEIQSLASGRALPNLVDGANGEEVALLAADERLVGIGVVERDKGVIQPRKIFN
jgi:tRNA pseudouridine55 synthase